MKNDALGVPATTRTAPARGASPVKRLASAVMVARSALRSHRGMHRHSWILFVVIGGIGLVMSCVFWLNPAAALETLGNLGPAVSPSMLDDPFLAFVIRWTATALMGANALTVFVASTAYRRGERWAGLALLYWPVMFASHLFMYRWGPMSFVQLGWLALTVPALAAHLLRSTRNRTAPVAA